ncbi:MAG: hypothetical protein JWR32_2220 [Mycobacterium sp.]|nr:hypothetical protein [Mycobacterium sp.]
MTKRARRKVAEWRGLLIAKHDDFMQHWRIKGHRYPFEEFLKSGADVVVSSGQLAAALEHAGYPCDRFDDGGPDAGRAWLLGADDSLTVIEDHHVAEMEQRDFDELVDGTGLRWRVDDAYAAAAVGRHAEWTRQIRASIKQGPKR